MYLSAKADKEKGCDLKCEVSLSVKFWKDFRVSKCDILWSWSDC